jgi:catechol 2,3-dioxygenase-like lactoylglutathione lyase family enzyme
MNSDSGMNVRVYGINHVVIEVDDLEKARAFYQDVFSLELRTSGERRDRSRRGNINFLCWLR